MIFANQSVAVVKPALHALPYHQSDPLKVLSKGMGTQ